MYTPEDIFDVFQTILITILLVITIPPAVYVYFKLLFSAPFSDNYTFKLIVVNGITGLLNSISYLIFIQLTSYYFMYDFYKMIERIGLVTSISLMNALFAAMSLNSALFVALNRVKRLLFTRLNETDSIFFFVSIAISLLLSLPSVLDFCFFTSVHYIERIFGDDMIIIPGTETSNPTLLTISNILAAVISIATFAVNMLLAVLITKEGQLKSDIRKLNAERGLIITSVVAYVFYMLYFVNNVLARYFRVYISANAQFMFLGIASVTPFWCLITFAPTIRRSMFKFGAEKTLTTVQTQNRTASI